MADHEGVNCPACLCPFTAEDWDVRHSDSDGEDVHEGCCDTCHGDDTGHQIIWREAREVVTTWGSLTSIQRERHRRRWRMIPDEDWQELAYNLSTFTVDLSLPGEPVKWGHLAPESCKLLIEGVKQWMRRYDGSKHQPGCRAEDGFPCHCLAPE